MPTFCGNWKHWLNRNPTTQVVFHPTAKFQHVRSTSDPRNWIHDKTWPWGKDTSWLSKGQAPHTQKTFETKKSRRGIRYTKKWCFSSRKKQETQNQKEKEKRINTTKNKKKKEEKKKRGSDPQVGEEPVLIPSWPRDKGVHCRRMCIYIYMGSYMVPPPQGPTFLMNSLVFAVFICMYIYIYVSMYMSDPSR